VTTTNSHIGLNTRQQHRRQCTAMTPSVCDAFTRRQLHTARTQTHAHVSNVTSCASSSSDSSRITAKYRSLNCIRQVTSIRTTWAHEYPSIGPVQPFLQGSLSLSNTGTQTTLHIYTVSTKKRPVYFLQ